MSVHRLTARFARVSLIGLLLLANALGQTGRRELTLEWIYGPEGRTVASVPATAWLDDGALVILDDRHPPAARTFEKLNPATGQRQSIVDAARALADLKRAVAGMNPVEVHEAGELFKSLCREGTTILITEHHMSLVMAISDTITVMNYGRKIAQGTPNEVKRNPEVLTAYLGAEAAA